MTLNTRRPTGAIPWPVILLEGGEKAGKTSMLALLSASARVGRTAILFLGEVISDEYGAYPGARYEIILHDGTWASIVGQAEEARAEAQRAFDAGEPPFVLGIDTATAEWELLKDWGSAKARSAPSNQKRLAKDPAAEIKVHPNIWNDVGARHARLMTLLLTFPGIVVITARGKEVARMGPDGNPVEGVKDYRVEGHKNLCYDVSCWVRMFRDKPAIVVGARSVHAGIRPGRDNPRELDPDWSLEGLIFDALKCDPKRPAVQEMVTLRTDTTPAEVRDEALDQDTTATRIGDLWRMARAQFADAEVMNETGDDENLVALLERVGKERREAEAGLRTVSPGAGDDQGGGTGGAAASALIEHMDKAGASPAASAAPARIRQEDQGAPAPTVPPAAGPAAGTSAEEEFVRDFADRLGQTTGIRQILPMQREIGAAIRNGKLTDPAYIKDLQDRCSRRGRELELAAKGNEDTGAAA